MSPSRLGTARGRAGACARDLPGGGVHGRMRTGSPRPAARALRGCAARCRSADRHAAPRQVGVLEEERVLASGAKAQGVQPRQRVPRHAGPLLLFRRCVLGSSRALLGGAGRRPRCSAGTWSADRAGRVLVLQPCRGLHLVRRAVLGVLPNRGASGAISRRVRPCGCGIHSR